MNMYQNSDFIEKEQPELSAETKWLIAQYQQEPNEASYLELREMVIGNYNAVLTRKEDKLSALKTETAESRAAGRSWPRWKRWRRRCSALHSGRPCAYRYFLHVLP